MAEDHRALLGDRGRARGQSAVRTSRDNVGARPHAAVSITDGSIFSLLAPIVISLNLDERRFTRVDHHGDNRRIVLGGPVRD